MGIATVAVYSDADVSCLHVQMADEAVRIGLAPAAESYLQVDSILAAIKQTGADAVHPGFGFLSENAGFAEALKAIGVIFIGPEPAAIAAMGDKIESKKIASKAGVSTVPGHLGIVENADKAAKIADEIGYPVMIKASAGGGGKGMRVAYDRAEVSDGFRAAASEAKSSFGDDRIFIEKYIEEPRHIEIQVLGDHHGNLIHLGERECSIQRRHQKVVEEAPSPFLDDKTRTAMGKEALALSKAVDYSSAGTVEFIVDKDKNFYFLEMNTRLQVEHPVTEYITGLDLVEQMIRVAAGEKLALTQKDVKLSGWAIEARVYAEDPARNFLPSIGRLVRYREPICGDVIRVDSGVVEGSEISVFYDPMIAKLVSGGKNRAEAIDNMVKALGGYSIQGISHNLAFLSAVVENQRFQDGALSTNFIAEEFPDGFLPLVPTGEMCSHFIAIIAFAAATAEMRGKAAQSCHYVAVIGGPKGESVDLDVSLEGKGGVINMDGATLQIESDWRQGNGAFSGTVNGAMVNADIIPQALGYRLSSGALALELVILSPVRAALYSLMPIKQAPDLSKYLLSPMPGLLMRLSVSEGTAVKAGEELAVVEAMKMENVLRAERDGTVSKVCTSAGESLNLDQVILEFED
jgi:propionyl-CoA carboxylase alpha chain